MEETRTRKFKGMMDAVCLYVIQAIGICLIIILFACTKDPIAPNARVFIKYYGFAGLDEAEAVEQTSDGGYVLVGSSGSYERIGGVEKRMYALKVNPSGNTVVQKVYGGNQATQGRALKLTSDGGALLLGDYLNEDKTSDIYLVKTNENLEEQWSVTINIPGTSEHGYALAILPSGNYFILGTTVAGDGTTEMFTAMVTPNGQLFKNPAKPGLQFKNDNVGKTIVVRSNGRLTWCGTQFRDHTGYDPGTSNIRIIFSTEDGVADGGDFDYGRKGNDVAADIQKVPGGYILVGTSESVEVQEGSKIYMIFTDDKGIAQWMKPVKNMKDNSLSLSGNQTGESVFPTQDGGFIILGTTDKSSYEEQGGQNIFLVKTNRLGDVEWEEIYGGRGKDEGSVVRETSDGGFIIAATVEYNGDPTICLIKTNSRGKLIQ